MGGASGATACSFFVATAFLAAARRFLVFAAFLPAALSFRVRAAFVAAKLRFVGIGIPFITYIHHLPLCFHRPGAPALAVSARAGSEFFILALLPSMDWIDSLHLTSEIKPKAPPLKSVKDGAPKPQDPRHNTDW